jgi:hypothetical protein
MKDINHQICIRRQINNRNYIASKNSIYSLINVNSVKRLYVCISVSHKSKRMSKIKPFKINDITLV